LNQQVIQLFQTYSQGVIAEMLGLTRSQVAGIIFRHRHGSKGRLGGRRTGFTYRHKTRFTRWRPPEAGIFQRGA
jgi:hypothetical protein